jgi:Lar family restriction alleviation protein
LKKSIRKPCPFCGNIVIILSKTERLDGATTFRLECANCGGRTMDFSDSTWSFPEAKALRRWNRRNKQEEGRR